MDGSRGSFATRRCPLPILAWMVLATGALFWSDTALAAKLRISNR